MRVLSILLFATHIVSSQMQLFSLIITQTAFDDAPTRYADFIDELLHWTGKDSHNSTNLGCNYGNYSYHIYLSQIKYDIEFENSDYPITIRIKDDGVSAYTYFEADVSVPVYFGGYWGVGDWCHSTTQCDGTISLKVGITISFNIDVWVDDDNFWQLNSSNIYLNPKVLSHDFSACGIIVRLIADIIVVVYDVIKVFFVRVLLPVVNWYLRRNIVSVNQSMRYIESVDGLHIPYQFSELEFEANEYIKATGTGDVKVQVDDGLFSLTFTYFEWYKHVSVSVVCIVI